MSRLEHARDAVRPALKARLLLTAPSGGGKTRSGLIAATVLGEGRKFLVIDTEVTSKGVGSALTYADDFTFKHLLWEPPFSPTELAEAIAEAGSKYPVVMVDSLTHFWKGEGGVLDIVDGKFGGWKVGRPAQNDLVNAVLACEAHVILCAREDMEHVQEDIVGKDGRKRTVVNKVGMKVQQDKDLEYELQVALTLDKQHRLAVSKSRTTALPVGREFPAGHVEDAMHVYADWLKGGEPPAPTTVVQALRGRMDALPPELKKACKQEWMARFGLPEQLRAAALDDAKALVAEFEAQVITAPPQTPNQGDATEGVSTEGVPADGDSHAAAPAEQHDGGAGADSLEVGGATPEAEPASAGDGGSVAPPEPTIGSKRSKALNIWLSSDQGLPAKAAKVLALWHTGGKSEHLSDVPAVREFDVRRAATEFVKLGDGLGERLDAFLAGDTAVFSRERDRAS